MKPAQDQDAAGLQAAHLVGVDAQVVPVLGHVGEPPAQALVAAVDGALEHRPQRHHLGVGLERGEHAVDVPPVQSIESRTDRVDIFLRHDSPRSSSIPLLGRRLREALRQPPAPEPPSECGASRVA